MVDLPACSERSCLDGYARAFGSKKGFDSNDPDQASAAAVALVVARDRRGELVPDEDHWTTALRQAHGPGADALRLAVANGMATLAPRVGKSVTDEAEAKALMHDVAGVLPGACETYVLLAGPKAPAASKSPDRSACVKRDLERKDATAPSGPGVWWAAAGMAALWKDEARALREGAALAEGPAKAALESKLEVIEAATAKMAFR
jgi:hypothetical protein